MITVAVAGTLLSAAPAVAQPIDTARIAAGDPNDWLTYHGSYNGMDYSGLDQINANNVKDLQVAWIHIPGKSTRGLQSMPLAADGVLYYTGSYSRVFALNGATGRGDLVLFPRARRSAGRPADTLALQPRRGDGRRQALCRHRRRAADRARHEDRQAGCGTPSSSIPRS